MNLLLPDNRGQVKIGIDTFETKYPILFSSKTDIGTLFIKYNGKKINIGTFLPDGIFYLSDNFSIEQLAQFELFLEEHKGGKIIDEVFNEVENIIKKD